jgi:hypothetical protein
LHGAHFAIPCEACHRTLTPAEAGVQAGGANTELRRKARAKGNQCQDCHVDPHAGQFRDARGETGCAQCHQDESDFRITRFDHQTMSRFPLDKTCGDCHDPRR